MKENRILLNWSYMTGKELYYIAESHFNGRLAGDGPFTNRCYASKFFPGFVGVNK